ncbi:MAG TPA: hypothetical protein VH539_20400 [Gemmatimonadaceae bacterium]|jgi:hypothetical protein
MSYQTGDYTNAGTVKGDEAIAQLEQQLGTDGRNDREKAAIQRAIDAIKDAQSGGQVAIVNISGHLPADADGKSLTGGHENVAINIS